MTQVPVVESTSHVPTKKWIAAQVVAFGTVATAILTTGFDTATQILLLGWAIQAVTTYLVPNDPTPGGVPGARWTHVEDDELEPFPASPVDPASTLPPE